ncbi:hypothetical protein ACP4OV_019308 [Aristida adscensionis]
MEIPPPPTCWHPQAFTYRRPLAVTQAPLTLTLPVTALQAQVEKGLRSWGEARQQVVQNRILSRIAQLDKSVLVPANEEWLVHLAQALGKKVLKKYNRGLV